MRLKLFAKNEVLPFAFLVAFSNEATQRQMLQFITALEKVAASSHFISRNRFDSFAPIRLNVSAQWLVDGVSISHVNMPCFDEFVARLLLEPLSCAAARQRVYLHSRLVAFPRLGALLYSISRFAE